MLYKYIRMDYHEIGIMRPSEFRGIRINRLCVNLIGLLHIQRYLETYSVSVFIYAFDKSHFDTFDLYLF